MADVWIKRCPRCGNYIRKATPQESGMCCACGWEEYIVLFYCEVVNRYCSLKSEDIHQPAEEPGSYAMTISHE